MSELYVANNLGSNIFVENILHVVMWSRWEMCVLWIFYMDM